MSMEPDNWAPGHKWKSLCSAAIALADADVAYVFAVRRGCTPTEEAIARGDVVTARDAYIRAKVATKRDCDCYRHEHLGPTTSEAYGHVLYGDGVCGWCEEERAPEGEGDE